MDMSNVAVLQPGTGSVPFPLAYDDTYTYADTDGGTYTHTYANSRANSFADALSIARVRMSKTIGFRRLCLL